MESVCPSLRLDAAAVPRVTERYGSPHVGARCNAGQEYSSGKQPLRRDPPQAGPLLSSWRRQEAGRNTAR